MRGFFVLLVLFVFLLFSVGVSAIECAGNITETVDSGDSLLLVIYGRSSNNIVFNNSAEFSPFFYINNGSVNSSYHGFRLGLFNYSTNISKDAVVYDKNTNETCTTHIDVVIGERVNETNGTYSITAPNKIYRKLSPESSVVKNITVRNMGTEDIKNVGVRLTSEYNCNVFDLCNIGFDSIGVNDSKDFCIKFDTRGCPPLRYNTNVVFESDNVYEEIPVTVDMSDYDYKTQYVILRERVGYLNETVVGLRQELAEKSSKVDSVEGEKNQLEAKLEEKQKKLNNLSNKTEKLKEDHDNKITAFLKELNESEKEIDSLEKETNSLKSDVNQLNVYKSAVIDHDNCRVEDGDLVCDNMFDVEEIVFFAVAVVLFVSWGLYYFDGGLVDYVLEKVDRNKRAQTDRAHKEKVDIERDNRKDVVNAMNHIQDKVGEPEELDSSLDEEIKGMDSRSHYSRENVYGGFEENKNPPNQEVNKDLSSRKENYSLNIDV